ncbi:mitochondrial acidic matrix protein [Scheffersomyces coipomensis]|uniref:mitochondrial acidic matrix protein n=1 Tax=Scheffersomyces coipomensis TaxID=1788519 RepID=UPI00315CF899
MLSSKVLSSALRAQSRNLIKRVNVRTITPSLLNINYSNVRNFQSSMVKFNAKEDLTNVLQSELKVTNTIPNTLDSIYEGFLVENKWDLIEKDGQSVIELKKTLEDGKIIRVFFDIEQITDTPYSEFDGEDGEFDGENGSSAELEENEHDFDQVRSEVDELDKLMCNVRVLIENPTSDTGVFFNLILHSLENSFIIDFVSNQPKASKFLQELVYAQGEFSDQLSYQGPRFSDLDESLQTQFETYLSSQGIDDQLAEFIVSYSEVKEEDEYRKWLSDLVTFFK